MRADDVVGAGDQHPSTHRVDPSRAGADPGIVGDWIEEVKLARKAAEVALRPRGDGSRLTADEIKTLVGQLKGIVEILENADPEDLKAV